MLPAQYTEQTGQGFSSEVIRKIYHYTQGKSSLVNAVACEIVEKLLGSDLSRTISAEHVEQAVQNIKRKIFWKTAAFEKKTIHVVGC